MTSGVATISQTSKNLTVHQSTNSAILNWQSFSVGAGNGVQFVQPSSSSVALNRVVGNSISEIYGTMSANGKVVLVNQNGILMGAGAQVDTGGLIASTLNIRDADFLAGRYTFDAANNSGNNSSNNTANTAGTIINNGRINTPSGYAVLLAPQVTNHGFINARAGSIALGAGNKVTLDMVGDGLISMKVDSAALNAAVVNTGTLQADGGQVLLKASSANALFDTVVNTSGIIRANSIANVNGRIVLDGGTSGVTQVTGEVSAKGANAGETGGTIAVLGDKVGLFSGAKIDASGDAGGGTVLVGGAWQGAAQADGQVRNASQTVVANGANIDASATTQGNGGTVVVWADGRTDMHGSIKATGADNGKGVGNGGNVETSGKQTLSLQGSVDVAGGKQGKGGQWLLDPADITISSAGNSNLTVANPTTVFASNNSTTATVNNIALGNAITDGAVVTVQTSGSGNGTYRGSITVADTVTASGAGTLNLLASSDITVYAAISSNSKDALNVGLYATAGDNPTIANAGTRGLIIDGVYVYAPITTSGGKFTAVGNSFDTRGLSSINTTVPNSTTGAGGDISIKTSGRLSLLHDINAGNGTAGGTVRLQGIDVDQAGGSLTALNLGVIDGNSNASAISTFNRSVNVTGVVAINSASSVRFLNGSSSGYTIGSIAADGNLFAGANGISSGASGFVLLAAAGNVTQAEGSIVSTPGALVLTGSGAYNLTKTGNTVGTLTSDGTGDVKLAVTGNLAVGRFGSLAPGVSGADVALTATGNIAVNDVIRASGSATLNAGGSITGSTIDVTAGTNLTVNGAIVATSGNVSLKAGLNAGNTLTLTGVGGTGPGSITVNDVSSDNITLQADSLTASPAGTLIANMVALKANVGIGTASNAINTQANALKLENTSSGVINFVNAGAATVAAKNNNGNVSVETTSGNALTVDTVDGLSGVTGRNINLVSGSYIDANQTISGSGAGTVNLIAKTDITVNSAIASDGTNAMNVGLYAGSPSIASAGTETGYVRLNSQVTTSGGKFTGVTNDLDTGFYITTNPGTGINTTAGATGAGGDITIRDKNAGGWIGLNGAINAGNGIGSGSTVGNSGGTVRLQAGYISQSIPGVITARNLGALATGTAVGGNYISTAAENNVSGTVALNATANTVFSNTIGFTVGAVSADPASSDLFTGATGLSSSSTTGRIRLTANSGDVLQAAGSNIIVPNLALRGAGNFNLSNADNSVSTVAGNGTGDKTLVTSGTLAVGIVSSITGITGRNISLTGGGDINVNQKITGAGASNVSLIAANNVIVNGLITSDGVNAMNVGLYAGSNSSLTLAANLVTTNGSIRLQAGSFAGNAAGINADAGTNAVSIKQTGIGELTLGVIKAGSLTIDSAGFAATVTANPTKAYDGNTDASGVAASSTGLVFATGSNLSTAAPTTASYDTKDAGTGKTVTATGFSIRGYNGTASSGLLKDGAALKATTTADITAFSVVLTPVEAPPKLIEATPPVVMQQPVSQTPQPGQEAQAIAQLPVNQAAAIVGVSKGKMQLTVPKEPITIPSCAVNAERPAAAESCGVVMN